MSTFHEALVESTLCEFAGAAVRAQSAKANAKTVLTNLLFKGRMAKEKAIALAKKHPKKSLAAFGVGSALAGAQGEIALQKRHRKHFGKTTF